MRPGSIDLAGVRDFAADRPNAAIWSARAARARRRRNYIVIALGAVAYIAAIVWCAYQLVQP